MDVTTMSGGLIGGAVVGIGIGYVMHFSDGLTGTIIITLAIIGAGITTGMIFPLFDSFCDMLDGIT